MVLTICALAGRSRDCHQGERPHGFHMRLPTPRPHLGGNGHGLLRTMINEATQSSIDATPAMFREINDGENIPGKMVSEFPAMCARVERYAAI